MRVDTSTNSADTPAGWAIGHAIGHESTPVAPHTYPPEVSHVEWSDADGAVSLNWGRWTVQATRDALMLRAEASDHENLQRIQDHVAGRLEKIGRRDRLAVTWHRVEGDT